MHKQQFDPALRFWCCLSWYFAKWNLGSLNWRGSLNAIFHANRCLKGIRTLTLQSWPSSLTPRWHGSFGSTHKPGFKMEPSACVQKCWAARCRVIITNLHCLRVLTQSQEEKLGRICVWGIRLRISHPFSLNFWKNIFLCGTFLKGYFQNNCTR